MILSLEKLWKALKALKLKVDHLLAVGIPGSGTVTEVDATAGTGISVSGVPINTTGTITITNTAPDQTVVLTEGDNINITGTYPSFTIGTVGDTGTFTSQDGKTITVADGIITSIV